MVVGAGVALYGQEKILVGSCMNDLYALSNYRTSFGCRDLLPSMFRSLHTRHIMKFGTHERAVSVDPGPGDMVVMI
jgi:hypothetical protein